MKLKWDLTLYHDPSTHAPTTHKLRLKGNGDFSYTLNRTKDVLKDFDNNATIGKKLRAPDL